MLSARPVPPALRCLVDGVWSFTGDGEAHRIVPDGCLDFVFDLEQGTGTVVGAMTQAQLIAPPVGSRALGVRFLPGQAARFLDAHADELRDTDGELAALTRVDHLAVRLAESRSAEARERALTEVLLDNRLRTRPADARLDRVLAALRRSRGTIAVSELSRGSGLSARQLERWFGERVGLGPKRLARVLRFSHANELLRAGHAQLEAALRAGYADEPHLLREFRVLGGATPRQLAHERRVGFVQDTRRRAD